MDNSILLSPIPLEDIKGALSLAVKQGIQNYFKENPPIPPREELVTRKQAAELFDISYPTLNEWTKTGKITGYRIASRIRYKRSELESSLKEIQSTK